MLNKNIDNQNDFAIIHIRPGTDGKSHPIGTVAVNLRAAADGELLVGYSIQHSKLDSWDRAKGREVAIGRAARDRASCLAGTVAKCTSRRMLIIAALAMLDEKLHNGDVTANRKFSRAVVDTFIRMTEAYDAPNTAASCGIIV